LPPEVLKWVPFWARHDAALSESRGHVYALIENAETPSIGMLSQGGRTGWEDYVGRVSTWVNTMPPPPDLTADDYATLYNDGV